MLCSFVRIFADSKMQIMLQWHLALVSTGTDGSEDTCTDFCFYWQTLLPSVCLLSCHRCCMALLAITHPTVLFLQGCSFTQTKHKLAIMIQIVLCAIDPSTLPHY